MRYTLLLALLMSVLVACSGGDDDNADQVNTADTPAAPPAEVVTGDEEGLENVEVNESGELSLGDEPTEIIATEQVGPTNTLPPPDFQPSGRADDPLFLPAATNPPLFGDNPQGDNPPPPGTLEPAITPEIEPVGSFTYISLTQSGGPAARETSVEIYNDGLVTLNGQQANVGLDVVGQLQATIDELNFFGMRGMFRSQAPPSQDQYTYQIYIETPNVERLVNAQDGMMPPELIAFVRQILDVGSLATP